MSTYNRNAHEAGISAEAFKAVFAAKSSYPQNGLRDAEKSDKDTVVLVESRSFYRECISQALSSTTTLNVVAVNSIEEWTEFSSKISAVAIVLCTWGGRGACEGKCEIAVLSHVANSPPVIMLSDDEDPNYIIRHLEQGVRGFISTSTPIGIVVEAIRLVKAGGTFVPARSLIEAQKLVKGSPSSSHLPEGIFTTRQLAVIDALRRGKSNKIIAYELNMCESTVKVHVRNIMKILNAKNRTQVAFITNELLSQKSL